MKRTVRKPAIRPPNISAPLKCGVCPSWVLISFFWVEIWTALQGLHLTFSPAGLLVGLRVEALPSRNGSKNCHLSIIKSWLSYSGGAGFKIPGTGFSRESNSILALHQVSVMEKSPYSIYEVLKPISIRTRGQEGLFQLLCTRTLLCRKCDILPRTLVHPIVLPSLVR